MLVISANRGVIQEQRAGRVTLGKRLEKLSETGFVVQRYDTANLRWVNETPVVNTKGLAETLLEEMPKERHNWYLVREVKL